MHNIELHIEKLMLHGFLPSDRHRISEAVKLELTRLFTERDIPPSLARGGEFARLDGGAFHMAQSAKAEVIGTWIAQSVYAGVTK